MSSGRPCRCQDPPELVERCGRSATHRVLDPKPGGDEKADTIEQVRRGRVWLTADECDLDDFAALVERTTDPADYPFAEEVISNVLVYDGAAVRAATSPDTRRALLAEWVEAMTGGLSRGLSQGLRRHGRRRCRVRPLLGHDRRAAGEPHGRRRPLRQAGANDRIWNALEKLCFRDPAVFAAYYGNEIVALVEAWLGPAYQFTSQINVVNPGSRAVAAPRLPPRLPGTGGDRGASGPRASALAGPDAPGRGRPLRHAGRDRPDPLSPLLANIPSGLSRHRESGVPRLFRPAPAQLPLAKGDAAFFNPALFHAAGNRRSRDVRRMANLLQVSSAYGRAMESVDRTRMSAALHRALLALRAEGKLTLEQSGCAVAACAEGYSFPTNLDRDPPLGGVPRRLSRPS